MSLHPAVAAVRLAVRRGLADLEPGATVLVACSGGADSTALLAATVFEARGAGWRVVGATVDHGLQAGSAGVADRVVARMAALGTDETLTARVRVEGAGLGPEAAARRARYAVLGQVRESVGADAVLLGHTRDDQAETVLLGLARGSGGRSLAGMRRGFDHYRRPLLDLSREDTLAACRAEGLEVWEDPHNADPGFARVRVRRTVLPVLERELGPGVAATLARTADQLRVDMDFLHDLAEAEHAALRGEGGSLPVAALLERAAAVRRRVLRLAALAAGAPASELFHDHVLAVDALLTHWHGQKWVELPGHVRCARREGRLWFTGEPG
ncbi:tRNA lysidine(34) synthetase TilS [Nocardioides panaciterrulae]|uniref:tRNA(Ile)-lysidine synthase n=1 Tax=Nocardioides panaciterrulae TaxID=661492 RepID=A0A7Y9E9M9_9ACTN|nr:tRNA lysidine(34) synthetase TilS [Nocardioides panaciterrulae]NYD43562.1 tRNA(Ile)-lysidine synthase [Nocardioides panaciterrulae]